MEGSLGSVEMELEMAMRSLLGLGLGFPGGECFPERNLVGDDAYLPGEILTVWIFPRGIIDDWDLIDLLTVGG